MKSLVINKRTASVTLSQCKAAYRAGIERAWERLEDYEQQRPASPRLSFSTLSSDFLKSCWLRGYQNTSDYIINNCI